MASEDQAASPGSGNLRVCDRCILRKVKCDLQRPVCSRCQEGGHQCVYSAAKRKPGPARGTRRMTKRKLAQTEESNRDENIPSFFSDMFMCTPTAENILTMTGTDSTIGSGPITPPMIEDRSMQLQISVEQERKLLQDFFDYIHPSIPLFRRKKIFDGYQNGSIPKTLLLSILVVTGKFIGGVADAWEIPNLDECLQTLLSMNLFEGAEKPGGLLIAFQQSCLLVFYRFHQRHGEDAWEHVSSLARKAYRMGLHQLDSADAHPPLEADSPGFDEADEWRYVWSCIYCLDSYSNIVVATPFVVERESIRTALVATSLEGSQTSLGTQKRFLPPDTRSLWKVSGEMGRNNTPGAYFNMHIVTTTLLREAATIYRLRRQSTSETLYDRHSRFEDHVSAVILSLPPEFLSETRNVFANETSVSHHARLICLLHLRTARLLNAMVLGTDELAWTHCFQQTLPYAQDIVAIVRQWDSRYCSTVDPAICFIVFSVLVLLHLHCICDENAQFEILERLETEKTLLLLFLDQFGRTWALPRSLKASFEKFSSLVCIPLSAIEIRRLMAQVPGPVRPWKGLLGIPPNPRSPTVSPPNENLQASCLDDLFPILWPL